MGGSLTEQELQSIRKIPRYKDIKYFVESGTYLGTSSMMAANHFDHVYTMEIHEGLHNSAKELAEKQGITNITFLLGDSVKLIGDIAQTTKTGAVYFIDAHISGSESGWNGTHRVPIHEELDQILQYNLGPSIFIIDDARLWLDKVWDWSHISSEGIVQKFLIKGYPVLSHYVKDDRFYIYI